MKQKHVVLAAIAAGMFVGGAQGALYVSDPLSYPDGNLTGNTPPIGGKWNAHSGANSHPIQVSSGAMIVDEAAGAEDDNVPLNNGFVDSAGTVLYSSFTVTIPTAPTALATVNFAEFLQGTSNFTSRLFVTTPATVGDGYRIGLAQLGTLAPATGVFSADLQFGQTYTVMTSYDFTNKNGSLWINPTDPSAAPIGTTTDAGFSDPVTAYAFRQSSTANNAIITVDNVQVGTNFSDVFGAPVPEPTTAGLLLGAAGLLVGRRPRRK